MPNQPPAESGAEGGTGDAWHLSHRLPTPSTNAIESINFQLRKIIKNRGHFPDDDAATKLLYLGMNRPGESGDRG